MVNENTETRTQRFADSTLQEASGDPLGALEVPGVSGAPPGVPEAGVHHGISTNLK